MYLLKFIAYRVFFIFLILLIGCKNNTESKLAEYTVIKDNVEERNLGVIPEFSKMGSGEHTLLFIPCMSCRWNQWEGFMQQNMDKYTMYAVTLPGNGGTVIPDLPLNQNGKTIWRDNAITALSNFIDTNKLKNVIIVGSSWGTGIGMELALKKPNTIKKLINVDGTMEDESWFPKDNEELERMIFQVDSTNNVLRKSADEWRSFNGATYKYRKDSISHNDVEWALKIHGSFMATPKHVLHQYWRENLFCDLTVFLRQLSIPILDIQSFASGDFEQQRKDYLETMKKVTPSKKEIKHVFLYKTGHFIMQHRPEVLSEIIYNYIANNELNDSYNFD